MAKDNRELYSNVQRRVIGSLLSDSSNISKVLELINDEDFEEPSLGIIFHIIAELSRADNPITQITVAEGLEKIGKLKEIGGPAELFRLATEGEQYLQEAPVEIYSRIVKESSAKSKIARTLEEAKKDFRDDSGVQAADAVSELQSFMNDQLLRLSDSSTVSKLSEDFKEYLQLIDERKEVSEKNSETADGLQGIPSLLPTLNKYTTGWLPGQIITVGARTGVGKALSINTPILTQKGWKTMETVKIGDKLYGRDGKLTKVTNTTEVMLDRPCYKFTFSNNETMIADAQHQWLVIENESKNEKILTTEELNINKTKSNYSIRATNPIEYSSKSLPIDPYLLGSWLSNNLEIEAMEKASIEHFEYNLKKLKLDKKKLIPNIYLTGSTEQRKELLLGLINPLTNKIEPGKNIVYDTFSNVLSRDFKKLISSLGIVYSLEIHKIETGGKHSSSLYRYIFDSSQLNVIDDYHDNISRIDIVSIDVVESVPVKCIEVDNLDHVYLAGEALIPTHNSIFAVNCALSAAKAKHSVLFFSLEMSKHEIEDRILASTTGIPMNKLKQGRLTNEERRILTNMMKEMSSVKLTIDVEPNLNVDSIRARALKQAQSPDGLDFIIIDYLQLISPNGRFMSRQEAVADISRNMKLLAKQLEVPIMVLVQLKRNNDNDEKEDNLPTHESIRESGAIAQDSDIVIILHREKALDDTIPKTLVILDKNRNGVSQKTITCHSNLDRSLFREITRAKDVDRFTDDDLEEFSDDLDLEEFDLNDEDFDL